MTTSGDIVVGNGNQLSADASQLTVTQVNTTSAIDLDTGTSTTGSLTADGRIFIEGGNVNGNVFSNGTITIDATGEDENSDGIATKITGNVTSVGHYTGVTADKVEIRTFKPAP